MAVTFDDREGNFPFAIGTPAGADSSIARRPVDAVQSSLATLHSRARPSLGSTDDAQCPRHQLALELSDTRMNPSDCGARCERHLALELTYKTTTNCALRSS